MAKTICYIQDIGIYKFVWHLCCTYLKTNMIFLTLVLLVLNCTSTDFRLIWRHIKHLDLISIKYVQRCCSREICLFWQDIFLYSRDWHFHLSDTCTYLITNILFLTFVLFVLNSTWTDFILNRRHMNHLDFISIQ